MIKYFDRNRRWLGPIMAGAMIGLPPVMMQVIGGTASVVVPVWITLTGLVIAAFAAGVGAMFTHTSSAHVVSFVATAAGFAGILYAFFK